MERAPFFADIDDGPEGGAAWWLTADDGLRIRLGVWSKEAAKGTVLLFPGRTEYIEKYGRALFSCSPAAPSISRNTAAPRRISRSAAMQRLPWIGAAKGWPTGYRMIRCQAMSCISPTTSAM